MGLRELNDKLEKTLTSKQIRWQLKQKASGNCVVCGKKALEKKGKTLVLCYLHMIARRNYMRKRLKCNAYIPGRPGRPIEYADPEYQPGKKI